MDNLFIRNIFFSTILFCVTKAEFKILEFYNSDAST